MAATDPKECPECGGEMHWRSARCRHCVAAGTALQAEIIHGYEQGERPCDIAARTNTSIWCVYNLASRLRSRGLMIPYAASGNGSRS